MSRAKASEAHRRLYNFTMTPATHRMLKLVAQANGLNMSAYLSARIHADYAAIMKKLPGAQDNLATDEEG